MTNRSDFAMITVIAMTWLATAGDLIASGVPLLFTGAYFGLLIIERITA